jgi:hypothetical protein
VWCNAEGVEGVCRFVYRLGAAGPGMENFGKDKGGFAGRSIDFFGIV